MSRWKHLHLLILTPDTVCAFDVPAAVLALFSGGRRVLAGEMFRAERNDLAALLAGGVLAELLASTRALIADSIPNAFVFEEV